MEVIVTHEFADFDALASAVAARRLHPDARVVLGPSISAPVREFLALHKDRFPVLRPTDVDCAAVKRVIVVDVRRASRLRALGDLLERMVDRDPALVVDVYDHHPAAHDDIVGDVNRVEALGAVTTLLVEELRRQRAELDPVEATLFALGVYSDTGSFCHPTTTPRDVAAGAWLLEQGANLGVLNRFLNPPMTAEQRRALVEVLSGVESERIRGADIGFAVVPGARHVEGLDTVTTTALSLEAFAALFVLQQDASAVQVVARSRSRSVDVGDALTALGGGGYASAAAARIRGADIVAVRAQLRERILAHPLRPERVSDVMAHAVHTLSPRLSLRDARASLEAWDVKGAPVLRDGTLVGIISLRDIARAARSGRLDVPVAGFMTQRLFTAAPDWTLEDALELMKREDVGRLPVLADGKLSGILSRSDLLRKLYGTA